MLDNVVNYNFPAKPKLFVHRVGRCSCYWSCVSHVTFWYGVPLHQSMDQILDCRGSCQNLITKFVCNVSITLVNLLPLPTLFTLASFPGHKACFCGFICNLHIISNNNYLCTINNKLQWIRRVQCFGLKESTCIYGTMYNRYIYMKNPPFDSLVWGSLRLAPITFVLVSSTNKFSMYDS